jgi:8-amino-3,8-dideoxy-alpha-D-manno-octulosonate transaminase
MEIALFRKTIDDLAEMGYSGRVHPHFYGEPLLDERLQELVMYIGARLPRADVVIYSNGDYLTLDLFARLIAAGTDSFVITPHDGKALDRVKALYSYANTRSEFKDRIEYRVFTEETPLSSRAGLVSPAKVQVIKSCMFPSECIVIDYLGNVVLCCDDYFSSVILGNVRDENLMQIWNKPSNRLLREQLGRGIFDLDICKKCTHT